MNILVFSPHFDDESIAIGGTIAKHSSQRDHITICYVTDGQASHISYRGESRIEYADIRKKETRNALAELATKDSFSCIYLEQTEGFLEASANLKMEFTKIIRELRPQIVYTPHRQDHHSDHQVVNECVRVAVDKAGIGYFPHLGKNIHRVAKVREYELWTPMLTPNLYISIDDYLERKKRAIHCYTSQIEHRNYEEGIIGLNRYRGFQSGTCNYAEAFMEINTV